MGQSNQFRTDLNYSTVASDEPFWEAVYRKAFPTLTRCVNCTQSDIDQRKGIDRRVILSTGRVIAVDEKKRRTDYGDILLEYVSVAPHNGGQSVAGWIEKPLAIDYIAYAFMQSKRCYLFDFAMLQRAWWHYRTQWLHFAKVSQRGFKHIVARNDTYDTLSVAVPLTVLQRALVTATAIQL